jgi:hypothetical protein
MTPKSFGVDLNLRVWRVGEKKLPVGDGFTIARRLLLQTRQQQKNGSMFLHCCKISKFENPILRLQEAERIKESHKVPM